MKATIVDAQYGDLLYIARHLSSSDKTELAVTRDIWDAEKLVNDVLKQPLKYTAFARDGMATMAFGASHRHEEGQVTVWGFKTGRYREVIGPVTKFIKKRMIPLLLDTLNVKRAECLVHPENRLSQRWLAALGFKPEATFHGLGPRRDDMLLYAVDHDALRH